MPAPRVHVSLGFLDEDDAMALASIAEELGVDGVTLPDHLFLPGTPPGQYPYSADGTPPFALDTPWPDAIVLAGAIGAVTSRLAVTTAVHVLPLRHPIPAAKAIATAARLCHGRFSLGVGVGWQREEFDALDVDFAGRGRLTDDAIGALRALWGDSPAHYDSESFAFDAILMEPKPPPVPILVGGATDAALRRAVALADGYVMPTMALTEIPGQLERLRGALMHGSRSNEGFRVFIPALGAQAPEITGLLAGDLVTDITAMPWPHPGQVDTTVTEKIDRLERWAIDVLEPLRA